MEVHQILEFARIWDALQKIDGIKNLELEEFCELNTGAVEIKIAFAIPSSKT